MEKRRLLLVVMLLATSGAVLASGSESEGGAGPDASTPRRGVLRRGAHKVNKRTRGFFVKVGNAFSFRWHKGTEAASEGNYADAALNCVAAPGEGLMNLSLSDVLPCLQENESRYVAFIHSGVTLGLGIALYKTIKSKKVQEGVKSLVRRVGRTFSFRKKAPEKKTDASTIEA